MSEFAWGRVASVSPLTVALDGSTAALAAVKSSDLALSTNDRVRVELADVLVVHLRVG